MRGLQGKVAVVTGGAQGLGLAICRRLSEAGCRVWMLDIVAEGREIANDMERETQVPVCFEQVDIRDEDRLRQVFKAIAGTHTSLDILVNNAAVFVFKSVDATNEEWTRILDVNIKGTSFVTKHAIPLLKQSKHGSIINLSSVSGLLGQKNFATYNATKFAILGLTKCWAIDFAADNIRVNSVCPGYIRTPAFENYCKVFNLDVEQENARISTLHILGRQGKPEEVANAVAFLASEEASFMTGSEIIVDGGYSAW